MMEAKCSWCGQVHKAEPSNQRLLLAGGRVLKELVFVRMAAHAVRASGRRAGVRVARSRNAIR